MNSDLTPQGGIRKAIRTEVKPFCGISMMGARTPDGSWVQYAPIPEIVGEKLARNTLFAKRVPIRVEVVGKEVTLEFVGKADFLGAAIISERNPEFRDFVVKLLMVLEETGVAPVEMSAGDVADDLDVQKAEAIFRASIKAARAMRAANEAKELASEAKQISLSVDAKVAKVQDDVAYMIDTVQQGITYRTMVVGLQRFGVKLPPSARSKVGQEVADIGRKLGYPVDDYPNGKRSRLPEIPFGEFFPIHYPVPVLMSRILPVWIRRNRSLPERKDWFKELKEYRVN